MPAEKKCDIKGSEARSPPKDCAAQRGVDGGKKHMDTWMRTHRNSDNQLRWDRKASLNKIKHNKHLQREHTFRIVRHNLIVFHKQMPGFDRMAEAAIKLAERSCPAGKVSGFPFL